MRNIILALFVFLTLSLFFVSSQQVSFVNSVNNVQYNNPSIQSIYGSSGGYSQFWTGGIGDTFDENMCQKGTDFALMIPPLGCQPMTVRSDLLAEQNVPVMCQLSSLRVNPLIRVSAIRSIGFSGPNPPEVAGISFYPARAGIRSYNTLLGDPLYNNVGYVVIILKKNPDERTIPKFIEGNLTARIAFDSEKVYGVGNAVLYLEGEGTGQQSSDNFATFWNGAGYVKMISHDSERAKLGVYTREGRLVQEVVLKEGETSGKIYLPGYYCQASLRIKLSEFTIPEDSAELIIDGESIWVRKGSKILNGRCVVTGLNLYTGNTGKVLLRCSGAGNIELSLLGGYSVNLSVGTAQKNYNVGDFVLKGNVTKGPELNWYVGFSNLVGKETSDDIQREGLIVLLGSNKEIKPEVYSRIAEAIKKIEDAELRNGTPMNVVSAIKNGLIVSGFNKDSLIILDSATKEKSFTRSGTNVQVTFNSLIRTQEIGESQENEKNRNLEITPENREHLNNADKAVKELLRYSPQVRGDLNRFAEIALLEQINLLESVNDRIGRIVLMETFLEKYSDSVYAGLISEMLHSEKTYNKKNARRTFEINGQHYSIILRNFKIADSEKKKVSIYAGSDGVTFLGSLSEGDEINLTKGKDEEKLRISRIYPNRVDVEVLVKKDGNYIREGSLTLRQNEIIEKKINNKRYKLEANDIRVQTIARVEIQADIDNRRTEANFSYKIGIEQRTIRLNPNKSSEKAERLNKTIQRLEERNNKLGELIKGWKATCLVTGLALNVKNMVAGTSGESLARQEVMRSWRAICKAEKVTTTLGAQRSLDSCYTAFNQEIEKDVQAYTEAVEDINRKINAQPNITKFKENLGDRDITGLSGGASLKTSALRTWDEIRIYLLYEKLSPAGKVSAGLLSHIKTQRDTKLQYLLRLKAETEANEQASTYNIPFGRDDEFDLDRRIRSWGRVYANTLGFDLPNIVGNPAIAGERKTIDNMENFFVLVINPTPTLLQDGRVEKIFNVTNKNQVTEITDVTNKALYKKYRNYVYKLSDCTNKMIGQTISYYETGNVRGLAATVPFDADKGWYVKVSSSAGGLIASGGQARGYTSAAIPETFTICNVGSDGIQGQDDSCTTISINQNFRQGSGNTNVAGCLLNPNELDILMRDAQEAIRQANRQYSNRGDIIIQVGSRTEINARRGSPQAEDGPIEQCQDFMSSEDCNLLFNICDPVMCPVSRCNFGGKYPVTNVIQSGIFGSLMLCLPNFKGFGGEVYVPICLTGVHAGIDGYISVLKAQRDCLVENAKNGRYTGMCDYVAAVYKCNLLWNNIAPFTTSLLPSLFSAVTGRQKAGGGEYLTFQKALNNMESSLDYFKNTYGSTSFTAFKLGNVEQIGTEVCNAFVGTSFPTTAKGLDKMLQPESPYQLYAEFQEIPHTDATIPPTSHYKVFAHIYAGKDQGVSYSVYLKNPPSSSYYVGIPRLSVPQGTGFISPGGQRQISQDFTAPAGYKELCVSINGKEYCNFGPVTTDWGINMLTDTFVNKQVNLAQITTEKECMQGSSGLVGFTSINPQATVTHVVDPRIDLRGVVRICSSVNPGEGTSQVNNWEAVGRCGDTAITCWLDKSSVSQATGQILDVAETITVAEKKLDIINEGGTMNEQDSIERVIQIKNNISALTSSSNNFERILKIIDELEKKGYSQRYQVEGVYWRFKLYERIVRLKKGLHVQSLKVDVPSAILPSESSSGSITTSGEKKFGDLAVGNMIVKGRTTYEIKTVRVDGENVLVSLSVKGQTATEVHSFTANRPISSEGYTWSAANPSS